MAFQVNVPHSSFLNVCFLINTVSRIQISKALLDFIHVIPDSKYDLSSLCFYLTIVEITFLVVSIVFRFLKRSHCKMATDINHGLNQNLDCS